MMRKQKRLKRRGVGRGVRRFEEGEEEVRSVREGLKWVKRFGG